jgi:hypothetical protein
MTTELSQFTEKPMELTRGQSRLDDSLFSKELAPHYMQLASKLASSELVPKSFRGKPQDLFICWAMGYQVGLSPEQSMQCIAVINGKPAMWGDDMLALCMAHKDFVDIIEEPILKDSKTFGFRCIVKRRGRADKISEFTLENAKTAGLLSKGGVWTQYPERMLKFRARGFCLRDAFPDALKGIKPREEVEDYIEAYYKVVDDKVSRTEFLKQDLKKKEELAETEPEVLPSSEEEPTKLEPTNAITPQQAQKIMALLEEKGFTTERRLKALEYYEVNSISELSDQQAEHYLIQLCKA